MDMDSDMPAGDMNLNSLLSIVRCRRPHSEGVLVRKVEKFESTPPRKIPGREKGAEER
jgi:hypothetical protein